MPDHLAVIEMPDDERRRMLAAKARPRCAVEEAHVNFGRLWADAADEADAFHAPSRAPVVRRDWSELDARRRFDRRAAVRRKLEEFPLLEAAERRDEIARDLLDRGVEFLDRVVEEAARRSELVFNIRKLTLQLEKIRVRLEVGIGFSQREQFAERAVQQPFGLRLRGRTVRRGCRVARSEEH